MINFSIYGMNFRPVMLCLTCATTMALSLTLNASSNLYQKAVLESESPTQAPAAIKKTNKAETAPITSAAVTEAPTGVLRLKDSFESKNLRNWKWLAGLHFERFGAEGSFTNPTGTAGDLGQVGKVLMPIFELGMANNVMPHDFYYQGQLRLGFARQNLNLQTSYGTSDASLSSVLLSTQAQAGYHTRSSSLGALIEMGRISYSQSSLQNAAAAKTNLNRSLDFLGYGFAFQQLIYDSLRGELRWIQRQNMGESENRIQSSNFEAGLSLLW